MYVIRTCQALYFFFIKPETVEAQNYSAQLGFSDGLKAKRFP
jgi:hypothetical protein